jgi:hypothetical protein
MKPIARHAADTGLIELGNHRMLMAGTRPTCIRPLAGSRRDGAFSISNPFVSAGPTVLLLWHIRWRVGSAGHGSAFDPSRAALGVPLPFAYSPEFDQPRLRLPFDLSRPRCCLSSSSCLPQHRHPGSVVSPETGSAGPQRFGGSRLTSKLPGTSVPLRLDEITFRYEVAR